MRAAERERTLKRIRTICLALPETSERLSHGAPTFFVRGKRAFLMVLTNHHGDGRFAIWCAAPAGMQKMLAEAGEGVLEREHAAPGRAEQVDLVEAEVAPQRRELVEEDLDAPVDVGRPVGAAAAQLVVDDDAAALLGEPLERREVMVRRARPAVKADERIGPWLVVADDAEPRPVTVVAEPALVLGHASPVLARAAWTSFAGATSA